MLRSNGNGYAETPNKPSFAVTNLDLRIGVKVRKWSGLGATTWFANHGEHVFDGNLGWAFTLHNNGRLRTAISPDGTGAMLMGPESPALGFEDGTHHYLRTVIDFGGGHGVWTYYEGDSIDGPWRMLGAPIPLEQATSLHHPSTPVRTPGHFNTDGNVEEVSQLLLLDDIDGSPIANPDFAAAKDGSAAVTDGVGNTWTLRGGASIGEPVLRIRSTADHLARWMAKHYPDMDENPWVLLERYRRESNLTDWDAWESRVRFLAALAGKPHGSYADAFYYAAEALGD